MSPANILAVLVVAVAMPLNWYVTFKLWRLSRRNPTYKVLRERAIVALAVAIIVTVFALIFVNNDLTPPPVPGDITKLVTRSTVLAFSVLPALYWLRLYR